MATVNQAKHTSAKEFVDPKVQTIPVTDDIIRKIMPFFPKSAKVISGYLNEEQLYWKVNYHWDVLLEALDHCSGLDIDKKYKLALAAIKKNLESNVPDPKSGYRKSPIGEPKDKSSHATILARHGIVRQAKKDFRAIVESADIFKKTKRKREALQLAYAPVAKPAQGKHSTGYALDISDTGGNTREIARIASALGAVKPFDEGSHVHCEWPNGVDTTARGGADSVTAQGRGVKMPIDNRIVAVRHCMLRME